MKSKLFFDHIYKAAGTTVDRILTTQVGADGITPGLNEPADNALARFRDKRAITGHFSFAPQQHFDPSRYYLTVLRHPVERVLSHYFFSRNDVPLRGGNPAVELAKSLSLEEYISSDVPEVRGILCNGQTQHFAPVCWDGGRPLEGEALLAAAKGALDRFDLVGIAEELEDTMAVLFADQDWPLPDRLPRANVTSSRLSVGEIDREIVRRLEAMNELDIRLHEHARECLRRKRSAVLARLVAASAGREGVPTAGEGGHPAPAETPPTRPPAREYGSRRVELLGALVSSNVSVGHEVMTGEEVRIVLNARAHEPVRSLNVGIRITDAEGRTAFGQNLRGQGSILDVPAGDFSVEFRFDCTLGYGDYAVSGALHSEESGLSEYYHWKDEIAWLSVIGNIGTFYEGYLKLHPRIFLHCAKDGAGAPVAALRDVGGLDGGQHLALHSQPLTEFKAAIEAIDRPARMDAGEVRAIRFGVENLGTQRWPAHGLRRVSLSYHWRKPDGAMVEYDGERTPLPGEILPGERYRQFANVKAPPEPGEYLLQVTLVQDFVAWFDQNGSAPAELRIEVGRKGDAGARG